MTNIPLGLTFDDVLLQPAASDLVPSQADTRTRVTSGIELNIPVLSAAMDTVTEASMAIVMAQMGGLGVLHRNLSIEEQCAAVRQVKRFESGMVVNPITIHPEATLAQAQAIMAENRISGIPVVEKDGKLAGILTNRDVRFAENPQQRVAELMTSENLAVVPAGVTQAEARRQLHQRRIEKLLVVDEDYRCVGLITVKDIEKAVMNPEATKDSGGRLRVAAATTVGEKGLERTRALVEAGCDVVIVDTAHGHSKGVMAMVRTLRKQFPRVELIAGNVATADGTEALIDLGVDGVKVGIGAGSICTTRVIAGIGMPMISALAECAEAAGRHGIPVIGDGGIRYSGDITKALAVGASTVMIGSLFAGTDESPGELILFQGRSFKEYRGMGSIGAMRAGSRDRYFQEDYDLASGTEEGNKLVPEGIEGRVPHKGSVGAMIHQLVGGLRAGMGYCGAATLPDLQKNARLVQITQAGMRESHVHDVVITKEAPNYRSE